jgi:2-methylcitrate dehydratase PrpD
MISAKPDPNSRSSSIIGAPLQLAIAALQPDDAYLVDRTGPQSDAALRKYAERVSVVSDEKLESLFPRQWPAEIEADTPHGTLVKRVDDSRGDPSRRLTESELVEKAHRVLDRSFGRAEVKRWIDMTAASHTGEINLRRLGEEFVAVLSASPPLQAAPGASMAVQ